MANQDHPSYLLGLIELWNLTQLAITELWTLTQLAITELWTLTQLAITARIQIIGRTTASS